MDKEKKQNKFLNKYLKWFILVLSIFIAIIIKYKNSYTALTLIPTTILAFLQSNIKQEELAEMQIDEMKKQQKEKEEQEKFEKMLQFVCASYIRDDKKSIEKFNKIDLGGMTIENLFFRWSATEYGSEIMATPIFNVLEMKENFYKNLNLLPCGKNNEYPVDIFKRELPKILNEDTFDFDKETWKSDL